MRRIAMVIAMLAFASSSIAGNGSVPSRLTSFATNDTIVASDFNNEYNQIYTEFNNIGDANLIADSVGASEIKAGAVGSSEIEDGSIVNADVGAAAAIALSKLATADDWDTSGALRSGVIENTQLTTDCVTTSNIVNETILDADINLNAAIQIRKLDTSAASFGSTGILTTGSVTNTVIDTGAVSNLKLANSADGLAYYHSGLLVHGDGDNVTITADRMGLLDGSGNGAIVQSVSISVGTITHASTALNGQSEAFTPTAGVHYYLWLVTKSDLSSPVFLIDDDQFDPFTTSTVISRAASIDGTYASGYAGLIGSVREDATDSDWDIFPFWQIGGEVFYMERKETSALTGTGVNTSVRVTSIFAHRISSRMKLSVHVDSGNAGGDAFRLNQLVTTGTKITWATSMYPGTTISAMVDYPCLDGEIYYVWFLTADGEAHLYISGWSIDHLTR